jgi:hypothetical protein
MTPRILFSHEPTVDELNTVKEAGYKVQSLITGGYILLFPNGVIEPFTFRSERPAWVFAIRHYETGEEIKMAIGGAK